MEPGKTGSTITCFDGVEKLKGRLLFSLLFHRVVKLSFSPYISSA
jgi:hypothetical protein